MLINVEISTRKKTERESSCLWRTEEEGEEGGFRPWFKELPTHPPPPEKITNKHFGTNWFLKVWLKIPLIKISIHFTKQFLPWVLRMTCSLQSRSYLFLRAPLSLQRVTAGRNVTAAALWCARNLPTGYVRKKSWAKIYLTTHALGTSLPEPLASIAQAGNKAEQALGS